jgi:hypothetical protein
MQPTHGSDPKSIEVELTGIEGLREAAENNHLNVTYLATKSNYLRISSYMKAAATKPPKQKLYP